MRMTLREYDKNILKDADESDIALIFVDVQNDFAHKEGSLYVTGGEQIVDPINDVINFFYTENVFWTKDWHPANHCSFKENGGPWPAHCIQKEWGSDLISGLDVLKTDTIILKGTNKDVDSYSAFFDNEKKTRTQLDEILREEEITFLFFGGIATNYCVAYSVKDALDLGYKVAVYLPTCRGIGDVSATIKKMEDDGAILIE